MIKALHTVILQIKDDYDRETTLSEYNALVDQIRNLSIYHDMAPLEHGLITGRALHRLLGDPGYESEFVKIPSREDGKEYMDRGMDGLAIDSVLKKANEGHQNDGS